MPTKREREYYRMGFRDGMSIETVSQKRKSEIYERDPVRGGFDFSLLEGSNPKKKRTLSAWQKFVKANSKKPRFVLRSGKLNLKKMGVAYRKTPAYRKKRLAERDKIRAKRRR